jgi:hypothetical protein
MEEKREKRERLATLALRIGETDGFAQDTTHTYTRWKKNTQRFSGTAYNLCLFLLLP